MAQAQPPVVLLHGWGGSFEATWTRSGWVESLLAAGREVHDLDLPGHGRPASIDPADYADLAGELAGRLPVGALDAVAYSLGAKLALALAIRSPGRFRRLVLAGVGDNLFAPEPGGAALAEALERGVDATTPPGLAALVRYAEPGGGDPRALAAVLRRPPNPVFAVTDLRGVADVLLVNGDADRIATPDARLRAALGGPEHLMLPGVDHLSLPADAILRRAAIGFLATGEVVSQEPA